ncbi:MAG: hypothetical protein A2Y14_04610 [Verrucomicrobia bacterium GWF2_51_19]|nr:MAG: hypothetical protein A2Y14_04610 [Verrucomicrobia bacterium GWF2_51_19]HCJ12311.1 hypothetical protein [Opitutae bacterium]
MKQKKESGSSWKGFSQKKKRAKPEVAANRVRHWRVWVWALIGLALVSFGLWSYEMHRCLYIPIALQHVENLDVKTDGALPENTTVGLIEREQGRPMMAVDLDAVKARYEALSQVKEVVVTRVFPKTLRVDLKEHKPLLKIAVKRDRKPVLMFVSEEGVLFEARGLMKQQVESLPYLTGVELKESSGRLKSLPGMELIASLMNLARTQYPHLYKNWKGFACDHFDPSSGAIWSRLRVETSNGAVIFGNARFENQLKRLDFIVKNAENGGVPVARIDLSLNDAAAVQLDHKRKKELFH